VDDYFHGEEAKSKSSLKFGGGPGGAFSADFFRILPIVNQSLPPNPVPKAVDKSMNKLAKAHACWCGSMCLKKQHLFCSFQTRQGSHSLPVLRLFLFLLRSFDALFLGRMH
jgi:hypothetical protein